MSDDTNQPENEPLAEETTDGLAFASALELTAPDNEQWHEFELLSIFAF